MQRTRLVSELFLLAVTALPGPWPRSLDLLDHDTELGSHEFFGCAVYAEAVVDTFDQLSDDCTENFVAEHTIGVSLTF